MGTIIRANVANRQFITISESHTQPVVAIAFAADQNDRFATASLDGTIRVWDIADYAVIATAHPRKEQERGVTPMCLGYTDILLSGWSDGRYCYYRLGGNNADAYHRILEIFYVYLFLTEF